MELIEAGAITLEAGLVGDHKGLKFIKRAVTVLALEDWRAALRALPDPEQLDAFPVASADSLAWTVRRANLLVDGVDLPKAVGGRIAIGADAVLEVTYPCVPCRRMEEARPGLLKALSPDWRGGAVTRVVAAGEIRIGDTVRVLSRPAPRLRAGRLP